ncbi:MAG TPA: hypothetical protein VK846_02020 [Candidatus Limnocylindria bacterium]|nr:hypothetical protein [Candidatus Limnocylindria bacterium]
MNYPLVSSLAHARRKVTRARVLAILAILSFALVPNVFSAAAPHSFLSYDDGLYSESPNLRPGKVDLLYKHTRAQDAYNAFLWTPVFKGGGGVIEFDGQDTYYGGGFIRPLAAWPDKGDLILGAQGVDSVDRSDFEAQGEYRFPFGLGIGGGAVSRASAFADVYFGKLTYRNKWHAWNYILEVQGQEAALKTEPGGYVAVYDEQWMGVGGTDGEQWRGTLAYIAPEGMKHVRPVIEAIWVDNSIGQIVGPKSLFANASLKYEGGFLSHPARLGRAMGPQGLEFGNPLGFLVPTFNRRLEVWEMGGLADFRVERIESSDRSVQERYEGYIYPAQFQSSRSFLDGVFLGGAWSKAPGKDTPSVIGGIFSQIRFIRLSVGVEYQTDPSQTSVVVGLIDRF